SPGKDNPGIQNTRPVILTSQAKLLLPSQRPPLTSPMPPFSLATCPRSSSSSSCVDYEPDPSAPGVRGLRLGDTDGPKAALNWSLGDDGYPTLRLLRTQAAETIEAEAGAVE